MNEHHRIATWWFRLPDLEWPTPDNRDKIRRKAEGFAKANVSAAMAFGAHFRWDFLPFFPLLHDYLATVCEELHSYGIKFFDHHSVNLVHRYSTREEMRHVMQDSGPHLPLSPTFEAAASWNWKGKYLNDWRMVDVTSGKPLWLPQYTAECFCMRNPEYREAYKDYVKQLIADTGIDGLSADDGKFYAGYRACGCQHCREELQRRSGIDLPPAEDTSFWGNWDNPAWKDWIDLRFDATGLFYEDLTSVLPESFMLTGCGSGSATAGAAASASDARCVLRGWNYVNMEMSGNTPPYKNDSKTVNVPIPKRLVNSSHHQAAAKEKGVRSFCTAFAHSTASANHAWAVTKVLDADVWIGTLKSRLGLPQHLLDTLPDEEDLVGEAFGFEAAHPELFEVKSVGQMGVYFSYETRNHSLFGQLNQGYAKDYAALLELLFSAGLCPHTVFTFPEDPAEYPVILLSSVAKMTEEERDAMARYLTAGGKVIVTGPTPLADCISSWQLPTRLDLPPEQFYSTVPDGVVLVQPEWLRSMTVEEPCDPDAWQEARPGLYYHPHRLGKTNRDSLLELVRGMVRPAPVSLLSAKGYLCTMHEAECGTVVHFLAADYHVDIDHKLDEMRYHRSRVNLLTEIRPIGVDGILRIESDATPTVYTPFSKEEASLSRKKGVLEITLPENCSYAILLFPKE